MILEYCGDTGDEPPDQLVVPTPEKSPWFWSPGILWTVRTFWRQVSELRPKPARSIPGTMRTRELTAEERFTWGDCSVCGAKDGEHCHADVGVQLGVRVDGTRMQDGEGAHLARLERAPLKVQMVPA